MRRILALSLLGVLAASLLSADVSIVERRQLHRSQSTTGKTKPEHSRRTGSPGRATGSQVLTDAQGLQYFINTDITSTTNSSGSSNSGAASEASFSQAVNATTIGGGTVASTLFDAFDGYNALCLSLDNTVAQCSTLNPNFVFYNKNGTAATECSGAASGTNRQVVFNPQQIGNIRVSRKVFVPDNDQFARWLNIFTNTGASPQTVTMVTSNNLGSDANTVVVTTSSGDATVDTADNWATSFQNYSGTTSSDPRLGHVFQGPGAPVPLAGIHFVSGDDHPYWGYTFTLAPGQTEIIANFVTGQPSKAAASAKAAELSLLPANALQCLTSVEQSEIINFAPAAAPVPTLSGMGLAALGLLLGTAAFFRLRRSPAA
jgi:hypothetical protein